MHNARLVRSALVAVLVASLVALATSCAGSGSGLVGNIGAGAWAGVPTTPGRPADYTGFLANNSGHVIILRSATLLPLKGFRAPKLIHEAIEVGKNFASSARDWPPTNPRFPLKNFAGYHVLPGRRVNILYSIVARKLGGYADAGIEVTVQANGSPVTVDIISVAATCIVEAIGHDCPDSFYKRIQKAPNA